MLFVGYYFWAIQLCYKFHSRKLHWETVNRRIVIKSIKSQTPVSVIMPQCFDFELIYSVIVYVDTVYLFCINLWVAVTQVCMNINESYNLFTCNSKNLVLEFFELSNIRKFLLPANQYFPLIIIMVRLQFWNLCKSFAQGIPIFMHLIVLEIGPMKLISRLKINKQVIHSEF